VPPIWIPAIGASRKSGAESSGAPVTSVIGCVWPSVGVSMVASSRSRNTTVPSGRIVASKPLPSYVKVPSG
jgi:hypothetical protein